LEFRRQLLLELLFFRLYRLLFRQIVELFCQRLDLLALFALHAFKIVLHLLQLPFQLQDVICLLGMGDCGAQAKGRRPP
jgi:hypothetical protein